MSQTKSQLINPIYGNINVSGITTTGDLVATGKANISGVATVSSLTVSGVSTFSGISTFYDRVIFNSTGAIQLPVGNTAERGTAVTGQVRYNSQLSIFEGYGPGGSWGSLGGVKDVDGNTYILPESAPGANENALFFVTDGTEKVRIVSSGDVGIGTTNPASKLDVVGNVAISGVTTSTHLRISGVSTFLGITTFSATAGTTVSIASTLSAIGLTTAALVIDGGVGIAKTVRIGGELYVTGDIYAFATSDERLKTNVTPIENALEKLEKLSGVLYDWNDLAGKDNTKREAGVIAQEVQKVLPEVVTERENGYLAVQYERIIPLLIEAIKELKKEIRK